MELDSDTAKKKLILILKRLFKPIVDHKPRITFNAFKKLKSK